jgi:hypothetical protein
MTDHQIGMAVVFGIALIWIIISKRRKAVKFIEFIEVPFTPARRKVPGFIVGIALVVGIAGWIWLVNH